jgi:hypothetical protein
MRFSPETFPIIEGHEPAASNGIANTSDAIKLTHADGVWIIIHEDYAVDANQLVLTLAEGATAVEAAAGTYGVSATFGGWKNITAQTSDAITAVTPANSHTLDGETAGNNCLWMFYFPAALLTNGRDWIQARFTQGDAGNIANVLYILDRARYQQASPPTAVA